MSSYASFGFQKPILIAGAPRSGTSLLQKIIRNHPSVWSLPSESNEIWDKYCHPALRGWESEQLNAQDCTPQAAADIRRMFHKFLAPAGTWRALERNGLIWGFNRHQHVRKLFKPIYLNVFPLVSAWFLNRPVNARMVEKTASNCFRLGYVNEIFPDAKIIYLVRDGRNNINSLINGWLHPERFFTYDVPGLLRIEGSPHARWKFVLPPGWREYQNKSLEEVCAFQWRACHEHLLSETCKSQYAGRVMRLKLEDLTADPQHWLRELSNFIELPFDSSFRNLEHRLPVVNSPDMDTTHDKWQRQNRSRIDAILPSIAPLMKTLGYE